MPKGHTIECRRPMMNLTRTLEVECECGTELIWWTEDETEDTMEVYVDCRECGAYFPKEFVSKSEDTSDAALESIAEDIAN